MFNKLKEKLNSFKKSAGNTIDEKAVEVEEPVDQSAETEEVKSKSELGPEPETEPVNTENSKTSTVSEQPTKSKSGTGFGQKAKAFVFKREFILDEDDIQDTLWDLEMGLLENDIALSVSEAIVESVKNELVGTRRRIGSDTGEIVENALKKSLYNIMSANMFDFDDYLKNAEKPVHVVFIGVNGTGKTTTIAKLAKRLQNYNYSSVIAAGDTFRAGAIDQIQAHANKINTKLIKHQEMGDPAAVVYDAVQYAKAHDVDVVLSDTAGRMHTNVNLMSQLEKVCRVSSPDLIIFVDEAVAGNDAVERAQQFNDNIPFNGSILTKADADSKGGAAISIAYITGKPILYLGVGQSYDDLKKFDPQWFVDQLFE